ncbi:19303_t:CDS:2, partial [Gigaspora margarita]
TNTLWRSRKSGGYLKSPIVLLWTELVEWNFEKNGTRLMIFGSDICANDNETGELAEVLLSIITVSKKEVMKLLAGKVQRICLFPTQEKRSRLRQWIGTAQWTYNQCLIAVKRKRKDLRAYKAMNDLLKEYKSNFAANRTNFKMKIHSKKDPQQSIANIGGKSRGEYSFLHKMNFVESLPKQLEYTSHLVINRLGKNDICQIYRLCYIHDRLQSKQDMIHGKGNNRVMLPRAMCTWSHFRFRQHLVHKAREHPWCRIILCTEEYTSKTCGFCGFIYHKLGGSKVFCCPECKTEILMVLAIFFFATLLKKSQFKADYSLTGLVLPNSDFI